MKIAIIRHKTAGLFLRIACRTARFIAGSANPEELYAKEPVLVGRLVRGKPLGNARPNVSHYGPQSYNAERCGKHELQEFLEES